MAELVVRQEVEIELAYRRREEVSSEEVNSGLPQSTDSVAQYLSGLFGG